MKKILALVISTLFSLTSCSQQNSSITPEQPIADFNSLQSIASRHAIGEIFAAVDHLQSISLRLVMDQQKKLPGVQVFGHESDLYFTIEALRAAKTAPLAVHTSSAHGNSFMNINIDLPGRFGKNFAEGGWQLETDASGDRVLYFWRQDQLKPKKRLLIAHLAKFDANPQSDFRDKSLSDSIIRHNAQIKWDALLRLKKCATDESLCEATTDMSQPSATIVLSQNFECTTILGENFSFKINANYYLKVLRAKLPIGCKSDSQQPSISLQITDTKGSVILAVPYSQESL